MSARGRRRADAPGAARRRRAYGAGVLHPDPEDLMLWLIIGIVLLVIAIAGGAIVHPILFVLGVLALVAFIAGFRGRSAL
jgi:hypothetical protein